MSYTVMCILVSNLVCIPSFAILLWQMGLQNWRWLLLVIPAIALPDLDHFLFTNYPGFGAHPIHGDKLLHVGHTLELLTLTVVLICVFFFVIDPARGRGTRSWFFPLPQDYVNTILYNGAWIARIMIIGFIIHWVQDLIIYTIYHKWNYIYLSLVQYFIWK
jgi:hypothetical protein